MGSPGAPIYVSVRMRKSDAPQVHYRKVSRTYRVSPRYGRGGSKTRSEDALTIGRITDHTFQQCVERKTLPPEVQKRACARNALLALEKAGVRPVRCQLPVQYGCVGTRLDGIGVAVRKEPTIVIIELKTTGDSIDSHSV